MRIAIERIKKLAVYVVALAAVTPTVTAETLFFTGKVIFIFDGDSLHIKPPNHSVGVRVTAAFYDSPELDQRYGHAARNALKAFIHGRTVQAGCHKKDRYGRLVCVIYYGTVDVNHLMIKEGYGHLYEAYEHELSVSDRHRYIEAEIEAQTARAGLWRDSSVIAPWEFRKYRR